MKSKSKNGKSTTPVSVQTALGGNIGMSLHGPGKDLSILRYRPMRLPYTGSPDDAFFLYLSYTHQITIA